MKTNIYIDGYNFYYGCIKDSQFKWLNLSKLSQRLCRAVFDEYEINQIRYFTAKIKSPPWDKNKHLRQKQYIRALKTIPNLRIHYGYFKISYPEMYLAESFNNAQYGLRKKVRVTKVEEKGSDVNLACHFLNDAFNDTYNQAIVISNDGDLAEAVEIAKDQFNKYIVVWSPDIRNPNRRLKQIASLYKLGIWVGHLKKSLFLNTMNDEKGSFQKPYSW